MRAKRKARLRWQGSHLASIEFLRGLGRKVELATYDDRLRVAARALSIPLAAL